ncbi:MAG: zinc ribbon domain-containing protein [Lewinella sp.]|nr:zinc ribbon domain-containing protein [Lewinella sp.]
MKECSRCGTALPAEARFCLHCGAPQLAALGEQPVGGVDWSRELLPQFNERFWARLEERVNAEQNLRHLSAYQEQLYQSGFRETVHRRLQQQAEQTRRQLDQRQWTEKVADRQLLWLIDDLLDFFFIIHASHLNEKPLPEAILPYQQQDPHRIDQRQMALAFLDFEQEKENVYTDLLHMPMRKLRKAGRSYLFPEKDEIIWFVCDQSLLNTGKEGFAMTEKALYWKSGLQPAQQVPYADLARLQREKEWLLINDLYFNASPTLNTKMIWLLRKLCRLHGEEGFGGIRDKG